MSNCQCGAEVILKPPALWLGNTEQGQPVIQAHCANGHTINVQLATMKPYNAKRAEAFPPSRGDYFRNSDSTLFCCPVCECQFGLNGDVHIVDEAGKVTPSIVCPNKCGFHSEVTLRDWVQS